jgi:nucleoside-diphosphate-sugar epimerase
LSTPPTTRSLPCAPADVDLFLSEPTPGVLEAVKSMAGPIHVLGAGGKMGLHLCLMLQRALTAAGRPGEVTAISRFTTLRDRDDFESRGIRTFACDLTDELALARLPDAPTIFFLAGVKFGTASNPELLQLLNRDMPTRVADRFRSSRFVAFSTGCVYPFVPPESGGALESTPVGPVGNYALSCVQREEAFAEASRNHGTPVVLIRLNYSVEFRYGVLVDIAQKVRARQPIDVTMGHVNVIWQRDAVAHIIQSAALAACPAIPLNITGPNVLAVRDLAERFGAIFGVPVRSQGREAETALLNDASQSHRRFGEPPTSLEQMLQWIAAWLDAGEPLWGKPTGFENRAGNF